MLTFESWMQLTNGGTLSIRNSLLRAVDNALLRYHQSGGSDADKKAIKDALFAWMQEGEGKEWKTCVRNRYQAIDVLLYDLLSGPNAKPAEKLSPEEEEAWKFLRDQAQKELLELFGQKKLDWRPGFFAKLGNHKWGTINVGVGIPRQAMALQSKGGSQSDGMLLAQQFLGDIPSIVREDVTTALSQIMPNFLTELAAGLVPFAGVIKSAGTMLWSDYKLIQAELRVRNSSSHIEHCFASGDISLATNALMTLLQRERNAKAIGAANAAATFTSKLATTLADGGTVTNAAIELVSSINKLINLIYILTRDCLERKAANDIMSGTKLDASVFIECPILGAYMICCVPSSRLVDALIPKPNVIGWKGQVEYTLATHWAPLREEARKLIQVHRFHIKELEHHPGAMGASCKELSKMWLKHKLGLSDMPNVAGPTTSTTHRASA